MASKKSTGQWHFAVDYQQLNANAPWTSAVLNVAKTVTLIQEAAHAWMSALDFKTHFSWVLYMNRIKCSLPLHSEKSDTPLTGILRCASIHPWLLIVALAAFLLMMSHQMWNCQYIDDIVNGGDSHTQKKKKIVIAAVQKALNEAEFEITPEVCQKVSKKVKFVGIWWIAGSTVIPLL